MRAYQFLVLAVLGVVTLSLVGCAAVEKSVNDIRMRKKVRARDIPLGRASNLNRLQNSK